MTDATQSDRPRRSVRAALVRLFGRPCLKQYVLWALTVVLGVGMFLTLRELVPIMPKATMRTGNEAVELFGFTADGKTLVTSDDVSVIGQQGPLCLRDVDTGQKRVSIARDGSWVDQVKSSPDGKLLTVVDRDLCSLWDVATGNEIFRVEAPPRDPMWAHPFNCPLSPDGRFLIYHDEGKGHPEPSSIVFWEVATKAVRARIKGDIWGLTIAKDGREMVLNFTDRAGNIRIQRWRLDADFPNAGPFQEHTVTAIYVVISPTFDTFASYHGFDRPPWKGNEIKLWDLNTGKEIANVVYFDAERFGSSLVFSPNGKFITIDQQRRFVSWPQDLKVQGPAPLWDVAGGLRLVGPNLELLHISPDDRWLLALTPSGDVELYDTATFKKRGTISVPGESAVSFAFHPEQYSYQFTPDSKSVLVTRMSHCETGNAVTNFLGQYLSVFQPKSTMVVRLWDVETAREIGTFTDCWQAVYSPDGKTVATAHDDGTIRLWDVPQRKPVWRILGLSLALWLSVQVGVQLWLRLTGCWFGRKEPDPTLQAAGVTCPSSPAPPPESHPPACLVPESSP